MNMALEAKINAIARRIKNDCVRQSGLMNEVRKYMRNYFALSPTSTTFAPESHLQLKTWTNSIKTTIFLLRPSAFFWYAD